MKKQDRYYIFGGVIVTVAAVSLMMALFAANIGQTGSVSAAAASPSPTARATSRPSQTAAAGATGRPSQTAASATAGTSSTGTTSGAIAQITGTSPEPPISVMDAPIEERVTRKGLVYEYTGLQAHLIGCTNVAKAKTSLKIPAKICVQDIYYDVTMIDCGALQGCTKLKQLTVGKYVKQIRDSAFRGDKKLKKIVFKGKKLNNVGDNAFKNTAPRLSFYMPATVKKKYEKLLKNGSPGKKASYKKKG